MPKSAKPVKPVNANPMTPEQEFELGVLLRHKPENFAQDMMLEKVLSKFDIFSNVQETCMRHKEHLGSASAVLKTFVGKKLDDNNVSHLIFLTRHWPKDKRMEVLLEALAQSAHPEMIGRAELGVLPVTEYTKKWYEANRDGVWKDWYSDSTKHTLSLVAKDDLERLKAFKKMNPTNILSKEDVEIFQLFSNEIYQEVLNSGTEATLVKEWLTVNHSNPKLLPTINLFRQHYFEMPQGLQEEWIDVLLSTKPISKSHLRVAMEVNPNVLLSVPNLKQFSKVCVKINQHIDLHSVPVVWEMNDEFAETSDTMLETKTVKKMWPVIEKTFLHEDIKGFMQVVAQAHGIQTPLPSRCLKLKPEDYGIEELQECWALGPKECKILDSIFNTSNSLHQKGVLSKAIKVKPSARTKRKI